MSTTSKRITSVIAAILVALGLLSGCAGEEDDDTAQVDCDAVSLDIEAPLLASTFKIRDDVSSTMEDIQIDVTVAVEGFDGAMVSLYNAATDTTQKVGVSDGYARFRDVTLAAGDNPLTVRVDDGVCARLSQVHVNADYRPSLVTMPGYSCDEYEIGMFPLHGKTIFDSDDVDPDTEGVQVNTWVVGEIHDGALVRVENHRNGDVQFRVAVDGMVKVPVTVSPGPNSVSARIDLDYGVDPTPCTLSTFTNILNAGSESDCFEGKPPSGEFHVGVALSPMDDMQVARYKATVTPRACGMAEITMQPLADDGTLTGQPYTARDVHIDSDGSWTAWIADDGIGEMDNPAYLYGEEGRLCGTGNTNSGGFSFGAEPWGAPGHHPPVDCEPEPIAACPSMKAGVVDDFVSGNLERTVRVALPKGYDGTEPAGLLVLFHEMVDDTDISEDLKQAASDAGIIIVAPEALFYDRIRTDGGTWWHFGPSIDGNRDVQFYEDVLTCASANFNVDPNRIYMAGVGQGGLFAMTLLTYRSEGIAAAASIHGWWIWDVEEANPDAVPLLIYDSDLNTWPGSWSEGMAESFYDNGNPVVECIGDTNAKVDGSWGYIVDFLDAHTLHESTDPFADGLPETFPGYCEPLAP